MFCGHHRISAGQPRIHPSLQATPPSLRVAPRVPRTSRSRFVSGNSRRRGVSPPSEHFRVCKPLRRAGWTVGPVRRRPVGNPSMNFWVRSIFFQLYALRHARGVRVLRLCSVKSRAGAKGENSGSSLSPERDAGNAMFFVSNLLSSSQAGRRRFESGLPLHLFNNLAKQASSSFTSFTSKTLLA